MTGEFARNLGALDEIFAYLGEFARKSGLGEEVEGRLGLVVEELFTNILKYGSGRGDRVRISIDRVGRQVRLELVDFDAERFDPASVGPAPLAGPIQERRRGGLGLHLVRSLVDRVTYEYRDREMRVSVVKNLET